MRIRILLLALASVVPCIASPQDASLTLPVDTIERRMRELAQSVASAFGCTAEVDYVRMGEALINNPEQTAIGLAAAKKIFNARRDVQVIVTGVTSTCSASGLRGKGTRWSPCASCRRK